MQNVVYLGQRNSKVTHIAVNPTTRTACREVNGAAYKCEAAIHPGLSTDISAY